MSADQATWRALQRTCYGLAGAHFLAVIQFVSAAQVWKWNMIGLITSVPLLLAAGEAFEVLANQNRPWSSAAGKLTVGMYAIGVGIGVPSLGGILGRFNEIFDYALRVSIMLALIFYALISLMTAPKN